MKKIERYSDVKQLVESKVDTFTDSMIEDIQDVIKVEFPEVKDFSWGILPPEYHELKTKLKKIVTEYIHENIIMETESVTDDQLELNS